MHRFVLVIVAMLSIASALRAQWPCANPDWLPGDGYRGVNGTVYATTMWDPDGPGPLGPRVVLGGRFTIAGNVVANNIAAWDPATGQWFALGAGIGTTTTFDSVVYAVLALPNGDLVVGGEFSVAGGANANSIARWNGTAWSALDTGVLNGAGVGIVYALTTLASGDIVVGGGFFTAGNVTTPNIARWNGSAWFAFGSAGAGNGEVCAFAKLPNGDLVAGGFFTSMGGVAANRIARWNGTTWSAFGTGMNRVDYCVVHTLLPLPNGDIIAGGSFDTAGGVSANRIARWNGSTWSAFGTGMTGGNFSDIRAVVALPGGDLIAAGDFTIASGIPMKNIARWNGSVWSSVGNGVTNGYVKAMTQLPDGDYFVAGDFRAAGSTITNGTARWNGSDWSVVGAGMDYYALALATLPNGDVIAGGTFSAVGTISVNKIARWNGAAWSALGSGLTGDSGARVLAVAALPNGDVIAGGHFSLAGGVVASNIARWNGSSWSSLGSGVDNDVLALTALPNGDLIAGGYFMRAGGVTTNYVARWNGSAWSAFGTGMNAPIAALTTHPHGDIIAGGYFTRAGGVTTNYIARWNGSTWSGLGTGITSYVKALTTLPNGDVIAGGSFSNAGGVSANCIARWNGSTWSGLGTGVAPEVLALTSLPNGDVVAGGSFTRVENIQVHHVARWNGSTWSGLGTGLMSSDVVSLAALPNGEVIASGNFYSAGGRASVYFARYGCPPCYANCDNSTFPPVLNANDFNCFLNKFAAADSYANCDQSTFPPTLNANDFLCFLNMYAAGCP